MANEYDRSRVTAEVARPVTAPRLVPLLVHETRITRPQLRPTVYLPSLMTAPAGAA